jgi:DNA-binding response OmpR family regulator
MTAAVPPPGSRIVLVDDEPRLHDMLRSTLQEAGLCGRMESLYDPVSFLEHLKSETTPPDLVLLDVNFENAGLSGIDILPFIREQHPHLPVILLTGMENEALESAQNYELVYYIPKPVSPEQLVRMVRYYLGMAHKSSGRTAELSRDLADYKQRVGQLQTELARLEIASWNQSPRHDQPEPFQRTRDILATVLKNCALTPAFTADLEDLYRRDFALLKKTIDSLVRFDVPGAAAPGLHIHRHHCAEHVYSLRLTKKARLFYYQPPQTQVKHLLRIDPSHDTRMIDAWLKTNRDHLQT